MASDDKTLTDGRKNPPGFREARSGLPVYSTGLDYREQPGVSEHLSNVERMVIELLDRDPRKMVLEKQLEEEIARRPIVKPIPKRSFDGSGFGPMGPLWDYGDIHRSPYQPSYNKTYPGILRPKRVDKGVQGVSAEEIEKAKEIYRTTEPPDGRF